MDRAAIDRLTKELSDQGKLIEAGWVAMRLTVMAPDAPQEQVDEMHLAYMAGAQHLYASITTAMDAGEDITAADMKRMANIADELDAFAEQQLAKLSAKRSPDPKPERLGDAPIDPAYREQMNALAGFLDEQFNGDAKGDARETGFVLLVFPFTGAEGGRCNFITNADRRDVVTLMKEMIARFEGQPEMKGTA